MALGCRFRDAHTVFCLIGSLATSVELLIWCVLIIWILVGWFVKSPWVLEVVDSMVMTNLVAATFFVWQASEQKLYVWEN